MSREFWQTEKQIKQLSYGKECTSRIKAYEDLWINRCYSDGLPDGDEVPATLLANLKVPSYKSIALCILKNDLKLRTLGFPNETSELTGQLERMKLEEDSSQSALF